MSGDGGLREVLEERLVDRRPRLDSETRTRRSHSRVFRRGEALALVDRRVEILCGLSRLFSEHDISGRDSGWIKKEGVARFLTRLTH